MTAGHAPHVSVLMPAYNHERWVGEAVASVLAQTLTDFELLVVDDGSRDGTYDVLAAFDDPRLRLLTHPGRANRGLHATLRLLRGAARGEWLSFLASDDAWEPGRLERLVATGASVAYCRAALMDEDSVPTGDVWGAAPSGDDLFADLLVTNLVPAATVVVRAAAFDAAGGISDARFEDLDIMLRLAARERVVFVAEPLARYRVNTTGIAAQVTAEGRTLAEYAAAVANVAAWPALPPHRAAAARAATDAWSLVLDVVAGGTPPDPPPDVAAVCARIARAWGLDGAWPPAVAAALAVPKASLLARARRRLRG